MYADRSTPIRLASQCLTPAINQTRYSLICTFEDRTATDTFINRPVGAVIDDPIANDSVPEARVGPAGSARCTVPPLHASGPLRLTFAVRQPGRPDVLRENKIYASVQTNEPDVKHSLDGTRIAVSWNPAALKWPDGTGPPARARVQLELYNISSYKWDNIFESNALPNDGSSQTYTFDFNIRDPTFVIGSILRPSVASADASDENSGPTIAGRPFCGASLVPPGALHNEQCVQWYSKSSNHQTVHPEAPTPACPPLESHAIADPTFAPVQDYSSVQYETRSILL